MTVTCKDCGSTIEISENLDGQYDIVDYDCGQPTYVCWPCCRKFAEINDSKGG